MECVACFDIGTTSIKGVLIPKSGATLGAATVPIKTYNLDGGYVEQDTQSWWDGIRDILRIWKADMFSAVTVSAVVMSGQMQDVIPIDKDAEPVRRAMLYSDSRADEQADQIICKLGYDTLTSATQNRFDGTVPLAKLLWFKQHEKALYDNTDKVLFSPKDYIIRKLTGANVADPVASATCGCMDLGKRKWEVHWLGQLELDSGMLPTIMQPHEAAGFVTEDASRVTGLDAGTPVLCGAGDAGAAAMGAGIISQDDVYMYFGTTGWVAMATEHIKNKHLNLFHFAHMIPDKYISSASILGAGNVHKWVASLVKSTGLDIDASYARIESAVQTAPAGSRGVLFLPYLYGERCPVTESRQTACFIGITPNTRVDDMLRSTLEGIAYSLKQSIALLEMKKPLKSVKLYGGGGKSKALCQIISDICGTDVLVPNDSEFLPSLGIASAAFIYLGWVRDHKEFADKYVNAGIENHYSPSKGNASVYAKGFEKYKRIYPAIKDI